MVSGVTGGQEMYDDANSKEITDEQRLLRHLLEQYEKAVRPVRNVSNTVVVRMGLTITSIFDMVPFLSLNYDRNFWKLPYSSSDGIQ